MVRCVACRLEQEPAATCRQCGRPLPKPLFGASLMSEVNPYAAPQTQGQIPGAYALAGRGTRLGAQVLDSLIGFAVVFPGLFLMLAGAPSSTEQRASGLFGFGVLIVVVAAVGLAIYQIVLLSTAGQTLGKKLLRIRIIDYQTGENPGFAKAFLLRSVVNGLLCVVPVYALVDVLFIFGNERRCVHDFIAGTKVVETGDVKASTSDMN